MDARTQIMRDEGLVLTPYRDSVGKLTIGYGRNLDDVGLSRDEADYMLSNDITKVRMEIAKRLPWAMQLDEARLAALINMGFNMGVLGLMKFTHTLALIKAGQYEEAATAMLESKWAKQVGERAVRLSKQMGTGQWV